MHVNDQYVYKKEKQHRQRLLNCSWSCKFIKDIQRRHLSCDWYLDTVYLGSLNALEMSNHIYSDILLLYVAFLLLHIVVYHTWWNGLFHSSLHDEIA